MSRLSEASSKSPRRSFAHVYDALYGGNQEFLRVQLAFMHQVFGPPPLDLLDLGCGTGIHLAALSHAGYSVTGIDVDPLMLRRARRNAAAAGSPNARLVLGDLRRLPFGAGFGRAGLGGALCLESPLAYLLDDAGLLAALRSLRGALSLDAKLLVDVYDYVGSLGTRPIKPQEATFETDEMRVAVRESHRYQKSTRLWTMRQRFEVDEAGQTSVFEVTHRLRMRTMDEYAQALERAGFNVVEAMSAYPNAPEMLQDERRLILVARR